MPKEASSSKQELKPDTRDTAIEEVALLAEHLPEPLALQLVRGLSKIMDQQESREMKQLVRFSQMTTCANRVRAERDAYRKFIERTLEETASIDVDVFYRQTATFQRLQGEFDVPLPTEKDIHVQTTERLRATMAGE
ncbi:hypothetical protein GC207_00025 [bacterium]|nr:hypothetical protein [bacterium]